MSGSSAIASARRRRTAPNEPIQTNVSEQSQVQNNNNTRQNNFIHCSKTIFTLEKLKP